MIGGALLLEDGELKAQLWLPVLRVSAPIKHGGGSAGSFRLSAQRQKQERRSKAVKGVKLRQYNFTLSARALWLRIVPAHVVAPNKDGIGTLLAIPSQLI